MKKLILAFFISIGLYLPATAQNAKPEFLKEPASWEFERFPLPPAFSQDFGYKGVEELRFAPGMFKKDSADYFSYAFVAQLDSVSRFTKAAVKNYLFKYFSGLCTSTAKARQLTIDSSRIAVSVNKKKNNHSGYRIYNSTLRVFGVFADGAPVLLNAEVKLLPDKAGNKLYMLFITSPREKSHAIWKELYIIQNSFIIP